MVQHLQKANATIDVETSNNLYEPKSICKRTAGLLYQVCMQLGFFRLLPIEVVVVVAFSSREENVRRFIPRLRGFVVVVVVVVVLMEISLRTLNPLFISGTVHSGSAS